MRTGLKYSTFGDASVIKSGYTPSVDKLFCEGEIPYFKVGDMNVEGNDRYLQFTSSYLKMPCKTFPKGSIVFPKNGAAIGTNKKRILLQPSVVDLNTAVLIPKDDYLAEYLHYSLLRVDFRTITRRGAVPTLDIQELKSLPIPNLSLEEQERIVAELDLLTSIIDKQKQQLTELDTLAQSIFEELYNNAQKTGCIVKPLSQIAVIKGGYTPSEKELSSTGEYPYFKVGDMNAECNKKRLIASPSYVIKPKRIFPKGAIVFPKNGAAIGTNKKRILAQDSVVDLNTAVLTYSEEIHTEFIYYWLLSVDFRDYTRRGAVPTLDTAELLQLGVVLPPISKQNAFAEKIVTLELQKEAINRSIAETQKLFDYTMDKYFG